MAWRKWLAISQAGRNAIRVAFGQNVNCPNALAGRIQFRAGLVPAGLAEFDDSPYFEVCSFFTFAIIPLRIDYG